MKVGVKERKHVIVLEGSWDDNLEIIKTAVETLSLLHDTRYFVGYGRMFFVVKKDCVTTHCMRENWNGWHDIARYRLPSWEEVGRVVQPDPSEGTHRATWLPE